MAKNDTMAVTILEDGTIRFVTDAISGANHANAEEALRYIARMAGGETTRERRKDVHHHTFTRTHTRPRTSTLERN